MSSDESSYYNTLDGTWDPRAIGVIAVSVIALVVFVACFIAAWFCKWPKSTGNASDNLRLFMLPVTLLSLILYVVIVIITTAFLQGDVNTPSNFNIIYIFESIANVGTEVLVLIIVHQILFRRLDQQGIKDGLTTAARYVTLAWIFLTFIINIASFGCYAKGQTLLIDILEGRQSTYADYSQWFTTSEKLKFAYHILVLILLIVLTVFLFVKVFKTTAKGESIPTLIALVAFFITNLDDAITTGWFLFSDPNDSADDISVNYIVSNIIIYNLLISVVVIALTIVGLWSRKQMKDQGPYPNYGGGNNYYNQPTMQQPPHQQQYYQQTPVSGMQGGNQFASNAQYQYPPPSEVYGSPSSPATNPTELSSGTHVSMGYDEGQQYAPPKQPTSPQMLYTPTPQGYRGA